jgi:hypothetical protein
LGLLDSSINDTQLRPAVEQSTFKQDSLDDPWRVFRPVLPFEVSAIQTTS